MMEVFLFMRPLRPLRPLLSTTLVFFELRTLPECFVTNSAAEGFLLRVGSHVNL